MVLTMLISNPKRPLDPPEEVSRFEYYCQRVYPYVLGLFIFILLVLAFIVMIKYGRLWFSTPQNHAEHLSDVVLYVGWWFA